MPRVIVKCRYYQNESHNNLGGLLNYIATRKGVEKLPKEENNLPTTEHQQEFILEAIKRYPTLKNSYEYSCYKRDCTKGSASEFISMALENRPEFFQTDNYLRYMATRPHVEKVSGTHGLFSDSSTAIDLEKEIKNLEEHQGNVFSIIISLKREDAARLGYDNAEQWREIIRSNIHKIAECHHMDFTNMAWYGAFHNESHHPHVHMLLYSKDPVDKAYITKKGIDNLRRVFGTEIFKDEIHEVYDKQTEIRNRLTKEMRSEFSNLINDIQNGAIIDEELLEKIEELSMHLKNCSGKKQYGYLPKSAKELVDEIVDHVSKNEKVDKLYDLWYQAKCSVQNTYSDSLPERLPLSKEKELKAIRNALIYECVKLSNQLPKEMSSQKSQTSAHQPNKIRRQRILRTAMGFAYSLSRIFNEKYYKYAGEDDEDIDKKLRQEIRAVENGEPTLSM